MEMKTRCKVREPETRRWEPSQAEDCSVREVGEKELERNLRMRPRCNALASDSHLNLR